MLTHPLLIYTKQNTHCQTINSPGSWDDWASQSPLLVAGADGAPVRARSGDAVRTLLVPRGVHDYKFIVDDKWRPAPSDPVARDQAVRTWRFENLKSSSMHGAATHQAALRCRVRTRALPHAALQRRGAACSCSPPLYPPTPQGATNNKRLLTGTGLVTFRGRRDMDVCVMGSWSDWTVRGCQLACMLLAATYG